MEEFTNTPVSFESLPKFESVPMQPLNKEYLNVVYIGNTIFTLVLSVATLIFLTVKNESNDFILPLIAGLFVVISLVFWLSTIGFRKKGYALREKDILFKKGIWSNTLTVIPFNRIQHVALHEGFFSRMYHLSELQIYTAGGSSSDLHIPGLPKEQAEQMKTFLLQKISTELEKGTPEAISLEKSVIMEETTPEVSNETENLNQ